MAPHRRFQVSLANRVEESQIHATNLRALTPYLLDHLRFARRSDARLAYFMQDA